MKNEHSIIRVVCMQLHIIATSVSANHRLMFLLLTNVYRANVCSLPLSNILSEPESMESHQSI